MVPAVRGGSADAPRGDAELASAGGRAGSGDRALAGGIDGRAGGAGGGFGKFDDKHDLGGGGREHAGGSYRDGAPEHERTHCTRSGWGDVERAHIERERPQYDWYGREDVHRGAPHHEHCHHARTRGGDPRVRQRCPNDEHPCVGGPEDGDRQRRVTHDHDPDGDSHEHDAGEHNNNHHHEHGDPGRSERRGGGTAEAGGRVCKPPRPGGGHTGGVTLHSRSGGSAVLGVDVAVVGAGAAGLYGALCLAREGARVALVSAAPLAQTASYWAQGGLAAALAEDDSVELHLADTERAGRGAVRRSAAEVLVREAPACVEDLEALGMRFDANRFGSLALGLEGGHSVRRVVHAGGSATGRRLLRELSALVAEEERIVVLENVRARALWAHGYDAPGTHGGPSAHENPTEAPGTHGGLSAHENPTEAPGTHGGSSAHENPTEAPDTHGGSSAHENPMGAPDTHGGHPAHENPLGGRCVGVVCEDGRAISARATILSTGGAAALWSRTTNPPGSQGMGLLLAHALGARLGDLEFVQFHPTAVIGVRGREGFLITEAIRGEGATLHDANGERFVDELAPRDEVSRAIWRRMAQTGTESVGLDMRGIDLALFPNVVGALREAGVDPGRELVPVAPAAHYTMGGVVTDLHGRSSVGGLYAVGETSCTGLHGANRLASNSLSECFVWARRAARSALDEPPLRAADRPAIWSAEAGGRGQEREATAQPHDPPVVSAETRAAVWRDAGIERSAEGLERLAEDPHPLARLIARCALERRESRGSHLRAEYPETDPTLAGRHIVVGADGELGWERWE